MKDTFIPTHKESYMNGRRARIVACALVLILLSGACSSGSSDRLTKAQYIAKADKICEEANQKTAALGAPASKDPKVVAKFLQKSGTIISNAVDQLKQLRPPAADEQKINQLVDGLQKSAGYFPALIKAVRTDNKQQLAQTAQQLQQASLEGQQVAQTYGFHVCAHAASSTATPSP
jgi:sugar diacid utilization regulator